MSEDKKSATTRLASIKLDDVTIGRVDPKIDHEREVAIYDIIDDSHFVVLDHETAGPYQLELSMLDGNLVMDIKDTEGQGILVHQLALTPFRRLLKDYFVILDSYFEAVTAGQPAKIEAIDMGRRGLHDEASNLLIQRLAPKIEIDFETARRLFTLLSALSWKE
jgi:uncharacterized protein (UPF0262 family)